MNRTARYASFSANRLFSGLLLCAGLAAAPLAFAQGTQSVYEQERAACRDSGLQGESLQACLRDAGAVQQERSQGRRQDNPASDDQLQQNAVNRCARLPADRQQECRDMMAGQQNAGTLSTYGNVEGGGVLREFSVPIAQ